MIDHSPGHVLPHAGAIAANLCQPTPNQIFQPLLTQFDSFQHAAVALLSPLGLRLYVNRLVDRCLGSFFLLVLLLGSTFKPFTDPARLRLLLEVLVLRRQQEHQTKPMFARELSARATALKRDIDQIDAGLVRLLA